MTIPGNFLQDNLFMSPQKQAGKLIQEAEKYARKYKDDDRQDIKTDILNAFYGGAEFGKKLGAAGEQRKLDEQREILAELREALDYLYSASPEGRAYLKRIDDVLNN